MEIRWGGGRSMTHHSGIAKTRLVEGRCRRAGSLRLCGPGVSRGSPVDLGVAVGIVAESHCRVGGGAALASVRQSRTLPLRSQVPRGSSTVSSLSHLLCSPPVAFLYKLASPLKTMLTVSDTQRGDRDGEMIHCTTQCFLK